MDHEKAQEHFSDYWDKSLGEGPRREVDEHLAACPSCKKEYEGFAKAMAPLGRLHRMAAPEKLEDAVPAIIHRRSRGRFFGAKRGIDRLPMEWLSLGMLGLMALIYVLLKLMHPAIRVP